MPARTQLAARRRALGYSQESLAGDLQVRSQSVARWEQGTSTPLPRFRPSLAESLQMSLTDLERLLDGADPTPLSGHAVPGWLDYYTSLEHWAGMLQSFEPISIPGLLQTRDYAEAVMRSSHELVSEQVVHDRVQARVARQAVLARQTDPLEARFVIDESVFHRVTGSRHVMAAQLRHLIRMGHQSSIEIRVVPTGSSLLHCAAFGSFRLFTANGAVTPFIACTEDLTGFNYLDKPEDINAHTKLFDHLTAAALPTSGSLDLIEAITKRYD